MSDDTDGKRLTRRRILAGVAGSAGIGLIGGAGTRAFLRDTEVVPGSALGNPYQGNHLDLELSCPDPDGACTAEADSVSFAFANVDPPAEGGTTFCPGLSGGPAWLWLKTVPSSVSSPLGEKLQVTLTYGNGNPVEHSTDGPVEDWQLQDLLDGFADGGMLLGVNGPDDRAFGETEERCLELSWSLPRDPVLSEQSVEFTLRFAAVQYRADVDANTSNPWGQS